MQQILFSDLGILDYQETWTYQEKLFDALIAEKKDIEKNNFAGHLLFVEHPHVFTLGKSGKESNLLINESFMRSKGASFYHSNRGGDITYHGPGQIVGYPILDLNKIGISIREYIFRIEESVIRTLKHFGIESSRSEGASGVWLDADKPEIRKICAIGVRASRSVTMHGFALNSNTDLNFYNYINPCGFVDRGVTSLAKELNQTVAIEDVKQILKQEFLEVFGLQIV
ncbi:MAG: lipoyl(octanoyl) transferase LipB [Lentimicrobiaceae bacterium]|jgi:lipoyl(octanoyl) transferase|nr:lipoyl(octanoyl) transferase LipB [Lentimicrobiaceae bacterium]